MPTAPSASGSRDTRRRSSSRAALPRSESPARSTRSLRSASRVRASRPQPAAAQAAAAAAAAVASAPPRPRRRLATFEEVRADTHGWSYLADNEHLATGYRHGHTVSDAFWSLLDWHNETVNVWTHLLGAAVFAGLLAHVLVGGVPAPLAHAVAGAAHAVADAAHAVADAEAAAEAGVGAALAAAQRSLLGAPASTVPQWPIAVFIASAVACLSGSAAFHLLHVVSRPWYDFLQSLDYAGIAVLICGSTVPMIVYGWACAPDVGAAYLAACVAIAAATAYVGLSRQFRSAAWRPLRVCAFAATGCFGVLPWVHLAVRGYPVYFDALPRLLAMGATYIGGAALYAARVPERWAPARFDYVLASHQIFHVCVFAAAWLHYGTVLAQYSWRVRQGAEAGGGC